MTLSASKDLINSRGAITAALAISAVGAVFYNLLPLFIGTAQDQLQLSDQHVGLIGSVFFLGYNLVTISAFFWIRRISWKIICLVSIPLAALSLLGAVIFPGYQTLLVSVFLSGGAFSAFYGVGATALGDTRDPARWYGMKIAVEALAGAVLLFLLPLLVINTWGFNGLLVGMAVTALLALPFVATLPDRGTKDAVHGTSGKRSTLEASHKVAIVLSLLAILCFFVGASAAWSFVERLGNDGGHNRVSVAAVLALTLLFAVTGSLLVAWTSDRFGYFKPHALAMVGYLIALSFLSSSDSLMLYGMGACLLTLSIGVSIPVLIAVTAMLDTLGRYIILSVPALGMGAMLGPGIAGLLTGGVSYTPILFFTGVSGVVSLLLVGLALYLVKCGSFSINTSESYEDVRISG